MPAPWQCAAGMLHGNILQGWAAGMHHSKAPQRCSMAIHCRDGLQGCPTAMPRRNAPQPCPAGMHHSQPFSQRQCSRVHREAIPSPALVPSHRPHFPKPCQQTLDLPRKELGKQPALPMAGVPEWEENVPAGLRTQHRSSCLQATCASALRGKRKAHSSETCDA